jgi:hypothetical protein
MGSLVKIFRPPASIIAPKTALVFPSSVLGESCGQAAAAVWLDAALIQKAPATLIWRTKHVQQPSYYSQFFRSGNFGGIFTQDTGYYGCCPYPTDGTTSDINHQWEVSIDFGDPRTGTVSYGVEYIQAAAVDIVGGKISVDFYYDIANGFGNVMSWTSTTNWVQKGVDCLIWGNNPWPDDQSEALSGWTRGWQQYAAKLSQANIAIEAANDTVNAAQTSAGIASLHYINQNPTPSDISDKSGNGHHPTWQNAARPTLITL